MAFVHMGSFEQGRAALKRYGLEDVSHISDPECNLYRGFDLKRVPLGRFLTWGNVRRALQAARAGHIAGRMIGDGLRMPGVFLLHDGRVVRSFRHVEPHDRPDYKALACPLPPAAS